MPLTDYFPGSPTYTERDYPDQTGKVYLVTGASSGIGLYTTLFLLQKNAKVWVTVRTKEKFNKALNGLWKPYASQVHALSIDYNDLSTFKPCFEEFLSKETRLDGVVHNAGVMVPPAGSKSKQGYETQLAVNAFGTHLAQRYLDDILIKTAKNSPKNSVRIVYVSALAINGLDTRLPVVNWKDLNNDKKQRTKLFDQYSQSKVFMHCDQHWWRKEHKDSDVLSLIVHPGISETDLQEHFPAYFKVIAVLFGWLVLNPPKYLAYTELYPLLHPDITIKDEEKWFFPWGNRNGKLSKPAAEFVSSDEGKKARAFMNEVTDPFFHKDANVF